MAEKQRFLFGRGEKLADKVKYRSGFGESEPVYDLAFQKRRFQEHLSNISDQLEQIPDEKLANGK